METDGTYMNAASPAKPELKQEVTSSTDTWNSSASSTYAGLAKGERTSERLVAKHLFVTLANDHETGRRAKE